MTTIVMNTLNGAVTEHSFAAQSVAPGYTGAALGLFTVGGTADAGNPITGEIRTGKTLLSTAMKKSLEDVYFAMRGTGEGTCRVEGASDAWEYDFAVRASGVSRAVPGKGIAENYVALGFRNKAGVDFRLDRIDVEVVQSKQRRT